ncbi:hypothetical protein, partial [Acidimangrovimonas sediminis]|uniref:hypothetical protein n=1 Tax=Acidimangrovimonas sediminis TaxID=2056283 RepID=UPI001E5EAFC3
MADDLILKFFAARLIFDLIFGFVGAFWARKQRNPPRGFPLTRRSTSKRRYMALTDSEMRSAMPFRRVRAPYDGRTSTTHSTVARAKKAGRTRPAFAPLTGTRRFQRICSTMTWLLAGSVRLRRSPTSLGVT